VLLWGYLVQLQNRQSSLVCQVFLQNFSCRRPGPLVSTATPPCFDYRFSLLPDSFAISNTSFSALMFPTTATSYTARMVQRKVCGDRHNRLD